MRVLMFAGKLFVSVGCGVLLFVAWTLWGTGIYTAREQGALERAFAGASPISVEAAPAAESPDAPATVVVPDRFVPRPGAPAFRIRVPRIDVDQIVVEGVDVEHLRRGPGHYPECRDGFDPPLCLEGVASFWPGEAGRVVVSGHRTTYGAPFWDLNALEPGDEIVTEARWGTFTYVVVEAAVVDDTEPIVISPGAPELVLTTCHPRYSADQRYLVFAELQEGGTS